jgi:hypothetical protein
MVPDAPENALLRSVQSVSTASPSQQSDCAQQLLIVVVSRAWLIAQAPLNGLRPRSTVCLTAHRHKLDGIPCTGNAIQLVADDPADAPHAGEARQDTEHPSERLPTSTVTHMFPLAEHVFVVKVMCVYCWEDMRIKKQGATRSAGSVAVC